MTEDPRSQVTGLFAINARSDVPIYRQIISQVKLLIAAGKLRPEDELPSIRALSIPLGVNPMTISKAYGLLESEGVVVRRPGRPLLVAELRAGRRDEERRDRLRESLAEAVAVARRLGFSPTAAAGVFRAMLDGKDKR